jgi:hypothetical protein
VVQRARPSALGFARRNSELFGLDTLKSTRVVAPSTTEALAEPMPDPPLDTMARTPI